MMGSGIFGKVDKAINPSHRVQDGLVVANRRGKVDLEGQANRKAFERTGRNAKPRLSKLRKTIYGTAGAYAIIRIWNALTSDGQDPYVITIAQPDTKTFIRASLPTEVYMDMTTQYESLGGAAGGQFEDPNIFAQTLSALSGRTQQNSRYLSARKWTGSDYWRFSLPLQFVAGKDTNEEITKPLVNLFAMGLPSQDAEGNLRAPGPRLKWNTNQATPNNITETFVNDSGDDVDIFGEDAGNNEEVANRTNTERLSKFLGNNLSASPRNRFNIENAIHLVFGNHMHLYPMYIENVNSIHKMTMDDTHGRPTTMNANVLFSAWVTTLANDLSSVFQIDREDYVNTITNDIRTLNPGDAALEY